jgi:DNA-binding response OmpR family regulator
MALYHLLSIGADPSVLATRSDVLKQAGYLVSTASSETSARQILGQGGFDLVVVCHSLSPSDRLKIMQLVRSSQRAKVVAISRSPEPEPSADASVHSLDGPDRLLECIAEVLGSGTTRISRLEPR